MTTPESQNEPSTGQSVFNVGLDVEKLLFEQWWGEPPMELNMMEPISNEQALSMWAWQAWQARAKLVSNVELRDG